MTLDIEINYEVYVFEQALKWYNLAFKDKHPNSKDENAYHRLEILVESMKKDEEDDKIEMDRA